MKKENFKYLLGLLIYLVIISSTTGQEKKDLWMRSVNPSINSDKEINSEHYPEKFDLYELSLDDLKNKLGKAPKRNYLTNKSVVKVRFPNPEGTFDNFEIFEASVMAENLQNKFPNIKSYYGKSVNDSNKTIHFTVSKNDFHALVSSQKGSYYVDPYTSDRSLFVLYKRTAVTSKEQFLCHVEDLVENKNGSLESVSAKGSNANDGILRTYRLAVSTTGEYSDFHLANQGISSMATEEEKKEAVLGAVVTAITRVNSIFERDLGIKLELVENNDAIIFLDSETDGLTNNNNDPETSNIILDENQTIINANIGASNYDIGHVFSTGAGGVAALKSVCTSSKAKGATGLNNPINDSYYVDYVSHEIGHQFGATHTFNSEVNSESVNCKDQKNEMTSVEPGSGSTIMAYAGLCGTDNIQSSADAYFHLVSIRQIWQNITEGTSTCAQETITGNSAPVLEPLANYTIPVSTPFVLDVIAIDAEDDVLTYSWEQLDTEFAPYPMEATSTVGPAFRSLPPSDSSKRYFPNLNAIKNGSLSDDDEMIPVVSRTMNFGITVRDNNSDVGQTSAEEIILTFDESSGPFVVTSQNENVTWDSGSVQTVEWDVANTNIAPINCSFVDIIMSTDGGNTFTEVLALGTPNDGSHNIIVPNISVNAARIIVKGSENVFFSMNKADIAIQTSEFVMDFSSIEEDICYQNNAVFNFTYLTYNEFNEETSFSASGIPQGASVSFSQETAISNGTEITMTISNLSENSVGSHEISVIGNSNSTSKTTAVTINVYKENIDPPILQLPEDNALEVISPIRLTWNSDENVQLFTVQISEDQSFSTLVEEVQVKTTFYVPELLDFNTTYYWRVIGQNLCGGDSFSDSFTFMTANEICNQFYAEEVPLNIPDASPGGVISILNITENQLITDINVRVNISHPWVEDLTLTLIDPQGKSTILANQNGGNGDNFTDTVFDQEAEEAIENSSAPFTGNFKPIGDLSKLNGTESYGTWMLKLVDAGPEDIGVLESWSLELCGLIISGNDNDKDGINNDLDLCENTPLGSAVNEDGCSIFNLPEENFTIEFIGETCSGAKDGQLNINSNQPGSYYVIIDNTRYSFSSGLSVDSLEPGPLTFCIKVNGEPFEQCFNLVVPEALELKGDIEVSKSIAKIEMLEGTGPFHVLLNDELILETGEASFEVAVVHGDKLVVTSAISCEGKLEKIILLTNEFKVFPNPTEGLLEVIIPLEVSEIELQIYSLIGQLLIQKTCPVENGIAILDLNELPVGMYLLNSATNLFETVKIVKK